MYRAKKAMKNFEVKEIIQKGVIRFRDILDNRCVGFIQLIHCCHVVTLFNDSFVHSCEGSHLRSWTS